MRTRSHYSRALEYIVARASCVFASFFLFFFLRFARKIIFVTRGQRPSKRQSQTVSRVGSKPFFLSVSASSYGLPLCLAIIATFHPFEVQSSGELCGWKYCAVWNFLGRLNKSQCCINWPPVLSVNRHSSREVQRSNSTGTRRRSNKWLVAVL